MTKNASAFKILAEVHRGWCNNCTGNVATCYTTPKGGCSLRDFEVLYVQSEEYKRHNPLGGPANVFEAIAERIRAGEDYYSVLDDYDLQHKSVPPYARDAQIVEALRKLVWLRRDPHDGGVVIEPQGWENLERLLHSLGEAE